MSLLSRVAERIYWTARYLERAETTSRLARVYGNLLLDLPREAGLSWDVLVQIAGGVADNFVTNIHVGRTFNTDGATPRLGPDVPRWYGETIGFLDGDALITWTSNIQGWATHAAFEHSSRMQTIEIYTPNRDGNGAFRGLNHEAILYDPEALIEPVRIIRNIQKISGFEQGDPQPFIECVQTIYPLKGRSTPVTPGTTIELEVPDMYGRPWARIWEQYWEEGMDRPAADDIFSFE